MILISAARLFSIRSLGRYFTTASFAVLALQFVFMSFAYGQDVRPATLNLTADEQSWLSNHPVIRLAVDTGWAPFEFVDENKEYRGMAAEYISLVEERLGISFQIDKERPWPKMVAAVKSHNLDAFSLVVRTPQRDEFVTFTRPYISFPMVIVSLKDEAYIDGVDALKNRTVAVVKSYASHDLLSKNHPDMELLPTENVSAGLEAVSTGQAYAFVGNLAVVGQSIREVGITNLKVSGQTPYRFDLSMAVRKDWSEFVPILQKALDAITPEERDQIYNRWIRVNFHKKVDYQIVLWVLAGAFTLVAFIVLWNRQLSREVKRRETAEHELKASLADTEMARSQMEYQATEMAGLAEEQATLKEAAEKNELRVKTLFDTVSDALIIIDDKGFIESFNPGAEIIFGFSLDEVIGKNVSMLMPEPDKSQHDGYLDKSHVQTSTFIIGKTRDLFGQRKNGEVFPISLTLNTMRFGGEVKFTGLLRDITDRKMAEEQIRKLAMTDQLTGIANRNQFNQRFNENLKLARRENKLLALMLLDLDKFKPVNDTYGHPVGDALLQHVASIFTKFSRDTDVVARLGGDEFAIILVHPDDQEAAGLSAQRIVDEILKPTNLMGHEIQIGTSVGISLFPNDAKDEENLIKKADLALYEAKEAGRNTFRFYRPETDGS